MKITILGCGSSLGVPALKYGWGQCDKTNQKNRRTRSSIKIDTEEVSLLVDTSPDLLWQLQNCENKRVDAVFYTHTHYDHTSGINELRPMFLGQKKKLHVYSTQENIDQIKKMFFYLFEDSTVDIYKSYMETHVIKSSFSVSDIYAKCFPQNHGFSTSLGLRVDDFAYTTDIHELTENVINELIDLDTWILDCASFERETLTHINLNTALQWIDIIKPRRAFLTHMDSSMDYDTLISILPANVAPAYDQMQIEI